MERVTSGLSTTSLARFVEIATDALSGAREVVAVGAALGVDPIQFVLGGGDDHGLLATFPGTAQVPPGWHVIGSVSEGSGVTVDGAEYEGPTGWTHF